jgi:tetratricopeptide (TPR) repeat protein
MQVARIDPVEPEKIRTDATNRGTPYVSWSLTRAIPDLHPEPALTLAHRAHAAISANELEDAQQLVERGFRVLGQHAFSTTQSLSPAHLRVTFGTDDQRWQAYGSLMLYRGRLALDAGQLDAAEEAFRLVERVGLEIADGPLIVDARYWLGRAFLKRGTRITQGGERVLQRVSEPWFVERALDCFVQAATERPVSQPAYYLAVDLLRTALTARFLGGKYVKQAEEAEADATTLAGDMATQLHLRRYQGRLALGKSADDDAAEHLRVALALAWAKWAPYQLADTYGMLGELAHAHPGAQDFALSCFATALIVWPDSRHFRRQEYERYDRLLMSMQAEPAHLRNLLMKNDSPLWILAEMPPFGVQQVQQRAKDRLRLRLQF